MDTATVDESKVSAEKKPIKCPRCGTIHWLFPGETVCCHGQTDSRYASRGICYLHVGRAKDGK